MKSDAQIRQLKKETATIWVVDDDADFNCVISRELKRMGFQVKSFDSGQNLRDYLTDEHCDLLLLDLLMPGPSGQEVLQEIKKVAPEVMVIVLTGHGTLENAVAAMKAGAYDFLTKPCELDQLEVVLKRAREAQLLMRQNLLLRNELARREPPVEVAGQSQAFQALWKLVQRVAGTDTNVLIQGESGTGKELVARALHHYSERHDRPFIVVDCGTLHDQLLESELFGHERGAYTGAISTKHGLFEVADTGTIFLDEIAELSSATQAKILRFLETQQFRRLGGTRDLRVDVRIIAATNKALVEETSKGNFREDLYYRLNVIALTVPPLRDRKDDIPILVEHFIKSSHQPGANNKYFAPSALSKMKNYAWPGNVRELRNAVQRALILADGPCIGPEYLPKALTEGESFLARLQKESNLQTLAALEQRYVLWVLQQVDGKKEQAARILGIDPKTLYRKLKMWGAEMED